MAKTKHGHHIPGTPDNGDRRETTKCPGIEHCKACQENVMDHNSKVVEALEAPGYEILTPTHFYNGLGLVRTELQPEPAPYLVDEILELAEKMSYRRGRVVECVTMAGYMSGSELDDLRRAKDYLDREIAALEKEKND